MTFPEFLRSYHADTLDEDAAWRAYDIQRMVRPVHVKKALKQLGMAYAGELAVPEAMARYGLPDRPEAEALLGAWYVWRQIAEGRRMQGQIVKRGRAEGVGWLSP